MTAYETYRWKWENYPKLYIVDRMPVHLDVEITTKCQLKCPMCEHTSNPPNLIDMPMEMYKKIIDEFAEKGGSSVKLCYLGEPLLYKNLGLAIRYAKQKGIIDVMLATNGNLLTESLGIDLIKSGLDLIIFSVDSCRPEVYKQIRVNGALNKVIEGLNSLNRLKKMYRSNTPRIQIQAIPMKENKEEIESGEYQEFWKPFADIVEIRPHCEDYVNRKDMINPSDFFCESVYQRMTIRADGKMVVCCGTRKDNKIVGDITKDTIENAWLGQDFKQIRYLMKERKSHLIEACKSCSFRISRMKK